MSIDIAAKERSLGRYDFEGNSYVRMAASPDVDTATALDMFETLIALKRAELSRKVASTNAEPTNRPTQNDEGKDQ